MRPEQLDMPFALTDGQVDRVLEHMRTDAAVEIERLQKVNPRGISGAKAMLLRLRQTVILAGFHN